MKTFSTESLDDLERGIKQLLLESRCSFSDDEKVLLHDCLKLISSIKASLQARSPINLDSLAQVVELVAKLVTAGEHLRHFL